ncbi:hypothetical protein CWC28_21830, partial [Pseudoalteromonas sp. S4492]
RAFHRCQVQRANLAALVLRAHDAEAAQPLPAAAGSGEAVVAALLGGDQHSGQFPVEGAPGIGDLRCDGVPQHLTDGGHQALADDGVVFRQDIERDMLADHGRQQAVHRLTRGACADIGEYGGGQRTGLAAAGLVG